jgi:CubicO group peptidase (beta-lactamase class C family)
MSEVGRMTRWVLIALVAACVAGPGRADPVDERLDQETEALERFLELRMARAELPGLVFGVVVGGELVWTFSGGVRDRQTGVPVDPATVFRIGSVTKTFTGAALLQLRDAGGLALDDPVIDAVPELASVVAPSSDSPAITYRHLVTHTSGLPRVGDLDYFSRPDQPVTEAELLAALDGARLEFAPGTRTRYSNLAAALAGLAVARLTERPYRDRVSEALLQPLGMTSTVWDPEDVADGQLATGYRADEAEQGHHWRMGAAEAMGGLYASLEDMARYTAFQMDAWPPRDDPDSPVLARASRRESQLIGGHASPLGQTFGVGWAVVQDDALGHLVFHTGATYQYACSVFMLPRQGIGVVAMTNTGAPDELDRMAKEALERLASAFPGGVVVQDDALAWGLTRVQQLMESPNDELIAETFSPVFLSSVPAVAVQRTFESLGRVGICGEPELVRLDGPGWGTFRLTCENDVLQIFLVVDATVPHRIQGLRITSESEGDEVDSDSP